MNNYRYYIKELFIIMIFLGGKNKIIISRKRRNKAGIITILIK